MAGMSVLLIMGILSFLFIVFLTIFLVVAIYTIITYVFESIAVMEMLKRKRYFAWIPFYNKYLLGNCAGYKKGGMLSSMIHFCASFLGIYCYVLNELKWVTFLTFLILLFLGFIFDMIIAHKIYTKASKYADLFTVFSVLTLGFLRPIFLFLFRKKIKDEVF